MSDFDLSFRFYYCMDWIKKKGLSLRIESGAGISRVRIGTEEDFEIFSDVEKFCLFVEGMMKAEEWKVGDAA